MVEEKKAQTTVQEAAPEEEVPLSDSERITELEGVVLELVDKVEKLTTDVDSKLKNVVTKTKGLFGGKRERVPTKDLKTGKVYASKAAVGKAFAAEAGADPLDSMAYYKVTAKLRMPDNTDRFVDASKEEGAAAIAAQEAETAREVAEMNAKLQAEEAAKAQNPIPAQAPVAQAQAQVQAQKGKQQGKK